MAMTGSDSLTFQVAPHIVEDLGLNLYTSLPQVLAEFVANAHDADSPYVDVLIDFEKIRETRRVIRQQFSDERAVTQPIKPLAERVLPDNLTITIEDAGHGMSRADLKEKFLIAGRRRRKEDYDSPEARFRTPKGRPLMGRKGLGKLAGFGVAKRLEVISRASGEPHATKITLDYNELVKARNVLEVAVPEERIDDGGGLPELGGTRIILANLLHDPVRSRKSTIERELSEHFEFVEPDDFEIRLNGQPIEPPVRDHAYAWPEPDKPIDSLIERTLNTDEKPITFSFRLRFTTDRKALPAEKRGVRVYAGPRLAANPSLLDADTNMHGFRMTDYLDGVVRAPFIDLQETDYVATDRQSLRWEAPLLAPLKDFLSEQIKEACKEYQKVRDNRVNKAVTADPFTLGEISKHPDFSRRDVRLAKKIAGALAKSSKRGVADPSYKNVLPTILQGLGHGQLLDSISKLSTADHPNINELTRHVARLTRDEFEQFAARVRTRIKAIQALKKIVQAADFSDSQNEKEIQKLFEKAPWLVDPTYTQFLTADMRTSTLFERLAKHLDIGAYAHAASSDITRPDLVFLIGNVTLQRLVIVELKSANLPLEGDHLDQLVAYRRRAQQWLQTQGRPMAVHGHLIGSKPDPDSKARGAIALMGRIEDDGPSSPYRVRDYIEVVEETEQAHAELLEVEEKLEKEAVPTS